MARTRQLLFLTRTTRPYDNIYSVRTNVSFRFPLLRSLCAPLVELELLRQIDICPPPNGRKFDTFRVEMIARSLNSYRFLRNGVRLSSSWFVSDFSLFIYGVCNEILMFTIITYLIWFILIFIYHTWSKCCRAENISNLALVKHNIVDFKRTPLEKTKDAEQTPCNSILELYNVYYVHKLLKEPCQF